MTQITTLSKYDLEDTKDVYMGQILRHLPVLTIITCHYQIYTARSHTNKIFTTFQHLSFVFSEKKFIKHKISCFHLSIYLNTYKVSNPYSWFGPIYLFIYFSIYPPRFLTETSDIDNIMASLLSPKIASNKCSGIAL